MPDGGGGAQKGERLGVPVLEVDEAPIVQNGKTVAIVGALRDVTEAPKERET